MTTLPTRCRAWATAAVLCGIATMATAGCAAPAPVTTAVQATTASTQQHMATAVTVSSVPVVVDCAVRGQTHPRQYDLSCAAGGAYLSGLHWASWGLSTAFADGIITVDDCVPTCVAGHGHSFPVLVALWRAEPRPGHSGQRFFTRLTIIYTGNHAYKADGTLHPLPATATYPLSAYGGA